MRWRCLPEKARIVRAATLALAMPVPEFAGRPSPRYPWPFWGARLLPGRELAESGLPDSRRGEAAAAVGHFLRALHEPALVAIVGQADLPVDPMRRASPPYRAFAGRARTDLLSAYGKALGAGRELAARALAISLVASQAEYAADEGRAALLRESIAGLHRAVAA